jgi:hypothetical protein
VVRRRDRRLPGCRALPPAGAACRPAARGSDVRTSACPAGVGGRTVPCAGHFLLARRRAGRRKRLVLNLACCRAGGGRSNRRWPARCTAMTSSRQATDNSVPAAKPSTTPGASGGSSVTTTSGRRWPRPGTPGGRCGRPWPPERADARSWPGGTHGQGTESSRCQSRCRATATVRGCRPASPGSAPVPATQATLLVSQLAMPCSLPMTRQGAGRLAGARFERGVGDPGGIYPAQSVTVALLSVHARIK